MGEAVIPKAATARAREWRNAGHASVCDVIEPWAHGTVVRATRHPTYYDFNVLRVEEELDLDVPALAACADRALAGLSHRRVDFDLAGEAEARRADFEWAGWKTTRLVWMLHEEPLIDTGRRASVEEVPYDETAELRLGWHLEDHPEMEYEGYIAGAREIALKNGDRVLGVRGEEGLIAFAQLAWRGRSAEITAVYVHPSHRGGGLGTAITSAAIEAAAGAEDLWIVADDEDRPKDLYARLGFRGVWVSEEFLRLG
jgi:ribosomal protein S18 acetylase RimI-like enzyme